MSADATPLALLCADHLPRRVGLVMGSEHEGVAPEILEAAQTVSDIVNVRVNERVAETQ